MENYLPLAPYYIASKQYKWNWEVQESEEHNNYYSKEVCILWEPEIPEKENSLVELEDVGTIRRKTWGIYDFSSDINQYHICIGIKYLL